VERYQYINNLYFSLLGDFCRGAFVLEGLLSGGLCPERLLSGGLFSVSHLKDFIFKEGASELSLDNKSEMIWVNN
jgi:hypothetical protein